MTEIKQLKITDLYDSKVQKGPIEMFTPNPWNVNEMDEATFEALKESIRTTEGKYLRENPLKVRKNGDVDKLEIVDGEHRWLACKELGLTRIPFEIVEIDTDKAKKLNVIYSRHRGEENYFKLSKLLNDYYEENDVTQEEMAKEFGFGNKSSVNNILKIYPRIKNFKEKVWHAKLSNRQLDALSRCRSDHLREKLIDKTLKEKWTSKQIRSHASALNALYDHATEKESDEKVIQEIYDTLFSKFGLDLVSWDKGSLKNQFNLLHQEFSEKKVLNEDCIKAIPGLDYEFDAIIGDPPFSLSAFGFEVELEGRKNFSTDFGEWDFFEDDSKFVEFMRSWLEPAAEKLKEDGTILIFTKIECVESIIRILRDLGFTYRTTIIWHKTNPKPTPGKQYANSTEYIIYATKGDGQTFNPMGQNPLHNFIETSICMGNERKAGKHPTQKPLEVMEKLIETHTNTNDYVLDPFAGSGSTGVACIQKKRNFVLIEKDPEYFETAKQRLKNALKEGST